ncbi:MAG: glycoside hydrolase family 3 C-terminal domain-containing protein [Acidobacteria bacterium]|nr:glycoside hydrolase family 3 C-terminal domain-containing protein [Acidobacteriota bacterium]
MNPGRPLAGLALAVAVAAAAAPARPPSAFSSLTASERQAAQRWLRRMSLRERVAQLVMIPFYGEDPGSRTAAWKEFQRLAREVRVGGLVLLNRVQYGTVRNAEPHAAAAFVNRMQRQAPVPLIVAGDFERGASMRVAGAPRYPFAMAYGAMGDLAATRALGAATAREARALGVHWIFAPVADVNNNPDNPIINTRSFGENPEAVAAHVRAFIEGAKSGPHARVLVTLKHFPGHGDTATDSHLGLAGVTADRNRLDRVELGPFRAGIAAGADAVMTAHITVPALEPRPIPATVSRAVLTGLLREELGFRGIIATDAMDMQGLTAQFPGGEAAVRALEAGADLLLIPPRPEEAIGAVVAAVKSGRLSARRIEESVARILAAKVRAGLHRRKLADLEAIADVLDSPEDLERAQAHAEAALTLVKNAASALPLQNPGAACYVVLAENRSGIQGRRFADEVRRRQPKASLSLLDPALPDTELEAAANRASQCDSAVIAAFVSVAAYRGDVALAGGYPKLVETLLAGGKPVVLVSLGNPYLLRRFPGVAAYLAAFSTMPASEAAAVKALFSEIPPRGRLPVTIPGLAKIGDGIQLSRTRRQTERSPGF